MEGEKSNELTVQDGNGRTQRKTFILAKGKNRNAVPPGIAS